MLSIVLRALHQIGAALFLASYLLGTAGGPPRLAVHLAAISGAALLFCEWMRHRQIHRELAGMSTAVKLILLGLVYHAVLPAAPAVLLAFVLASLAAHAPREYRHRLLY